MRVGDSYKIKSMAKAGVSESDICHKYRNSYSADEVKKFIPGAVAPPVKAVEAPKPKPKRKSRAKAKT